MKIIKKLFKFDMHGVTTSMSETKNAVVKAVKSKKTVTTDEVYDIIRPHLSKKQSGLVKKKIGVKSIVVFPMIVRREIIGAMAIGLDKPFESISAYKKDLLNRLVSTTGIAIDNALLYQKIHEANERLKQLDVLKDEFVSVASHELRTPMTAIKSYLWLALAGKGGKLSEKLKFYLDRSYTSANRLIKLINDMLNVSRIESGRMSFEIQKTEVLVLVEEIIGEVKPRADELGVSIIMPTPKDVSKMNLPSVLADPDKIKEILMNLIGNSLKFTPKKGSITISFEKKDSMVTINITDTGEGIEKDDIPKLFQKFSLVRGSYQTNKQSSQGTGLGLYICKMIMKEHGGDIWAISKGRGKGATFGFSLKTYTKADASALKKLNLKEGLGIIHSEID